MKNLKAQSARWFKQATQKSLKAFLIFQGRRFVTIHSVGELLKEATSLDSAFSSLLAAGKRLDRHYLATRYPDALPEPAIPAESYVREEAEEAIATAESNLNLCWRSMTIPH